MVEKVLDCFGRRRDLRFVCLYDIIRFYCGTIKLNSVIIVVYSICDKVRSHGGREMPTIEAVKVDGDKLQGHRLGKFLSRDELSAKSGIHRDHIGRLERGEGGNSRPPTVRKLAEALEVDPTELVASGRGDG